MATTQEILDAARKVGKMIETHDAAQRLHKTIKRLEQDVEAQRAMTDYQRLIEKLAEKEATGRPIEVEDKRQLESLQTRVARNLTLQQFQLAQMDYLDLMRQVDSVIGGDLDDAAPVQPAASPLINPDIRGTV